MVHRVKITVLGEPSVGKTSIVAKYCKDQFPTEHRATLGADFTSKKIKYLGKNVELVIWDIAGTTSFEIDRMSDYYLQGSNGYFLVYDLTSQESLKMLAKWQEKAKRVCHGAPFIILGNKNDLEEFIQKDVEYKDDLEMAKQLEIDSKIIQTSAKTGENIEHAFVTLLEIIWRDMI